MSRPIFTLLLLLGWWPVLAQYRVRHFTSEQGLTQTSVYYFLDDSRGYLWMTSQKGLNRLDGDRIQPFVHQDNDPTTISKGEVRGLVEAPNGDIWTGTEVGLSRYIRKTGRFQTFYLQTRTHQRLLAQCQPFWATDSTVWFLNDRQGVVCLNHRRNHLRVVLPDVPFRYSSLTRVVWMDTRHGYAWFRLPVGVLRYTLSTGERRYYFTNRPDNEGGDERAVYALYGPADGSALWLSTNRGLVRLTEQGIRTYAHPTDAEQDPAYSLTTDHNGRLWVSSSRSGLFVLDTATGRVVETIGQEPRQPQSLLSNFISEVFTDRQGGIWANSDPKGVNLIEPTNRHPTLYADNPDDSTDFNGAAVRGIVRNRKGQLWVGTVGQGLRLVDPKTGRITRPLHQAVLEGASIRALCYNDATQELLIGTKNGVSLYEERTRRFRVLPVRNIGGSELVNSVRGICALTTGYFLIATQQGLYAFDRRRQTFTTLDSASSYSGTLLYDAPNQRVFAGRRDRDLQCFSVNGTTLTHQYDVLPGLSPLSLRLESANRLWIGTDNGLLLFDTQHRRTIRHYTERDGLPDRVVYSLLADNRQNLWLTTDKGIVWFDKKGHFRQLPETAGIEFNSNAGFQADPNTLYFGSTNGLHVVKPQVLRQPQIRAIRFTELQANDQPLTLPVAVDESDTVQLSYAQRTIAIGIAVLNYTANRPLTYQYRLIGQHTDWLTNPADVLIRYTNLPAGSFQLQVRAMDNNGEWSPVRGLTVIVEPPFWQQGWFIGLIVSFFALLIYGLLRLYVRRKQAQQQRLTRQLLGIQEEERLRIAQDLHDDVGNTLATIKGILDRSADTHLASATLPQARDLLVQAMTEMRTISHNLMPVDFAQTTLSEALEHQLHRIRQSSSLTVRFIVAGEPVRLMPETELTIYRIIAELLQNIRKHAQATEAVLQLIYAPTELVVSVEDNGAHPHPDR
jgi:signal transduction histidine kinase/ligand-binding sensor domain-containing protein